MPKKLTSMHSVFRSAAYVIRAFGMRTQIMDKDTHPIYVRRILPQWPKREESYAAIKARGQGYSFRVAPDERSTNSSLENKKSSSDSGKAVRREAKWRSVEPVKVNLPKPNMVRTPFLSQSLEQFEEEPESEPEPKPEYNRKAEGAPYNDQKYEQSDPKVRGLHEVIFGLEEADDYEEQQRAADSELLQRVRARLLSYPEMPAKMPNHVPEGSYNTHRNRWAAFRRRMIYGTGDV